MTDPVPQIVNVDQAAAWNGGQGAGWLEREDQHVRADQPHLERLLAAAAIVAGDHVLDVGCGTGPTTLAAARLVGDAGDALGIDISQPLLARAREHAAAAGLTTVTFEQADAQVAPIGVECFDVVISKFGVMFFADPVAAFANFARATKPGGRLAFVSWRGLADNPWLQVLRGAVSRGRATPAASAPVEGAPGMLGLADRHHITSVLTAAGWRDVVVEAADLPFDLGPLDDAFRFGAGVGVVKAMLDGLDDTAREDALADLRAALAAHEVDGAVSLGSGVWLVTARR